MGRSAVAFGIQISCSSLTSHIVRKSKSITKSLQNKETTRQSQSVCESSPVKSILKSTGKTGTSRSQRQTKSVSFGHTGAVSNMVCQSNVVSQMVHTDVSIKNMVSRSVQINESNEISVDQKLAFENRIKAKNDRIRMLVAEKRRLMVEKNELVNIVRHQHKIIENYKKLALE